jgi:hypothetical protein
MRSLLSCVLFLSVLAGAGTASAQDRRVVQNRLYGVNHEFTVQAGLLPLDVLYKAPSITGRYTWHINDFVAWEVLSLTYAPTTDISLIGLGIGPLRFNHFSSQGNELQDNFGYRPFDVDQMRLFAESNFVLTPLYGKFSLFNRSNARLELYGVGGMAVANFVAFNPFPKDPLVAIVDGGLPAPPTKLDDFIAKPGQTFLLRPGLDVGFGSRLFVSRRISFRLDARAYGFLEGYNGFVRPALSTTSLPSLPVSFTQVLFMGLGMSVSLGGPE